MSHFRVAKVTPVTNEPRWAWRIRTIRETRQRYLNGGWALPSQKILSQCGVFAGHVAGYPPDYAVGKLCRWRELEWWYSAVTRERKCLRSGRPMRWEDELWHYCNTHDSSELGSWSRSFRNVTVGISLSGPSVLARRGPQGCSEGFTNQSKWVFV